MMMTELRRRIGRHLRQRLSRAVHRQAITVVLIAVAAVVGGAAVLMTLSGEDLGRALFESVSAFATVGLSTGITPHLTTPAQLILIALMFLGRLGPLTLGSAIALRQRHILFDYPQKGPPLARFGIFGGGRPRRIAEADSVAVIGLGRFGSALALELVVTDTEVLGIDMDEELVQTHNGQLTQVVRADSTKQEALRQLAVHEFDRVVVAIGGNVSASILTCSAST